MSALYGTVVRTIPIPATIPGGMFKDGKFLWQIDALTDLLYQTDLAGNVIKSISPPSPFTQLTGVAIDGKNLIICTIAGSLTGVMDKKGNLISSFSTVYRDMADRGFKLVGIVNQLNYIEYDGTIVRSQNVAGAQGSGTLFKGNRVILLTTGTTMREHYTNNAITPTVGIRAVDFGVDPQAVTNDGRYLYVNDNDTNLNYQVIH